MTKRRVIKAIWALCVVAVVAFLLSMSILTAIGAGLVSALFVWFAAARDRVAMSEPLASAPMPDRTPDLIDAIDDPLLIIEGQRIAHANGAAVTLFGADKLEGDFRLALRHPLAAEVLANDEPTTSMPIELVGIGQKDRRWVMTVHMLPAGARLVRLRDRTESWVAERMRVDFVANASHELRTPLATVLGFIETLSDDSAGGDAPTRARFLGIMLGEARRMQQLVDDLMSLSRIEADRFSTPRTRVALGPVIEEVAAVIRTGLGDGGSRIKVEIGAGPDIRGDRAQMTQLMHNLIGNAVKYGRPGTPIRVSLKSAGGKVDVRVADEGDGIAPEHIPRLTERFYRVDAGRSRAVGGTGLGLAIVKHIAERHRARLNIASVVGQGTTVSVVFPAAEANAVSS